MSSPVLQTFTQNIVNRIFPGIGILFLLLFLSSCQGPSIYNRVQKKSPHLTELQHWFLKARVAIKSKEESISATLDWQKSGDDFDFHIYGMFGATYAHLVQKGHQATLSLPEDQVFHHRDAEQLLYQSLGWDFPIEALSYWIKGLPSGKRGESISRNTNGELQSVFFQDWQVEFSRFESYSGYSMPKIIKATHPQLSLKMVVKKWQFLPAI